MKLNELVLGNLNESFSLGEDGLLSYQGILCVPNVYGLRDRFLEEAQGSCYLIHSGSTKMYHNLREIYLFGSSKKGHIGVPF